MSLVEQVVTQAGYMARDLVLDRQELLEVVSRAVVSSLESRLREDLTVEDCRADFVTAAGMYAVAALSEIGDMTGIEQLTAGDVTVRRGGNSAAGYLRQQADTLMAPYLRTDLVFMGV